MNNLSINFRYEILGGHTHVAVFAGKDEDHRAKCGDLVFRNEEWKLLEPVLVAADRTILSAVAIETTKATTQIKSDDRPLLARCVLLAHGYDVDYCQMHDREAWVCRDEREETLLAEDAANGTL